MTSSRMPAPASALPAAPHPASADDLRAVTQRTLAHYEARAQAFWEGTRDHDVSQNIAALLSHISAPAPWHILDFGCGPGRDLMAFTRLGHRATGLEGSAALAALARQHSRCEVLEQNFVTLDLPVGHFDGVFANASLFHVPGAALAGVLAALHACLKPGGVLFSSNPRGDGSEGFSGERYGVWHDWSAWRAIVLAAGFIELDHYYRPAGLPREQQPWLASVWRKAG